jgi:hypothetical protein
VPNCAKTISIKNFLLQNRKCCRKTEYIFGNLKRSFFYLVCKPYLLVVASRLLKNWNLDA